MSQTHVGLIGTLRVSFSFHPSLYSLRTSTGTNSGISRFVRGKNLSLRESSTITTVSNQKPSIKRKPGLGHHRSVVNSTNLPYDKLYTGSFTIPTCGLSLSIGLTGSHYLLGMGKVIHCTEKGITQTVETTSETTSTNSQPVEPTTKENDTFSSSSSDKPPFPPFDSVKVQQITFGTSMGFASGYFVKKVSKTAAVLVGATFVLLQVLEQQGYITIYWNKIEENYNKVLDLDNDGKVTTNDFKLIFYKVVEFLGRNFQTDASFVIGFGVGFRYG